MNSVYESLRALLRSKELEIKKLEKEIEALRIVLPIVAEAGPIPTEVAGNGTGSKASSQPNTGKPYSGTEFENVMAQAAAASGIPQERNIPAPDLTPKNRTTWP